MGLSSQCRLGNDAPDRRRSVVAGQAEPGEAVEAVQHGDAIDEVADVDGEEEDDESLR